MKVLRSDIIYFIFNAVAQLPYWTQAIREKCGGQGTISGTMALTWTRQDDGLNLSGNQGADEKRKHSGSTLKVESM